MGIFSIGAELVDEGWGGWSMKRQGGIQRRNPVEMFAAARENLPCAPQAEQLLLAAIFAEGLSGDVCAASLQLAVSRGVGASCFSDVLNWKIYVAMRGLSLSGRAIEVAPVFVEIEKACGVVEKQLQNRILDVSSHAVSSLHAGAAIDELLRVDARRRKVLAMCDLFDAVAGDDDEAESLARGRLEEAGRECGGRLPRIQSASELMANPCPVPPVLVAGLLHRGAKLLIGGGSKSYKSWSMIDLALSVATGSPWLDMSTTAGRVLFLNFEIPDPFFRGRLLAVAKAKGLATERAGDALDVWTLRGHGADLRELVPQIVAQAAGRDYSLIVLDPIYKALGSRDENLAGDIADLLNEVEALAVRTGAAVAISHHFAKGIAAGKDSKDRMSGSGVWARDPDALMTLTPHESEGAFVVDFTLRNFAPRAPFVVRWDWPLMRRDDSLDPTALKQSATGGRPRVFSALDVVRAIEGGATAFAKLVEVGESCGVSRATVKRVLAEAVGAGWVLKTGKGYEVQKERGGLGL